MKKKFAGMVLIAVIAAAGVWWWRNQRTPETRYRTAVVERGSIQVSVTATGSLQVVDTVVVGTRVSGIISALYADFNSRVSKGQVIARIDTTLLYTSLKQAQADLSKARAQEILAQAELKRSRLLIEKNLISQSDLDLSEANAGVAAASLASARAAVESALINLRYATIVSPIDGIVMSREVNVGQTVAASLSAPTLFMIAGDLTKMQVLASVDEADIGKIQAGQTASFTVDAYPDTTFSGTLSQIRLQPIVNQNVVTYNIAIHVENPDRKLMSGMTATLTIAVQHRDDVLLVPSGALRFQPPEKPKSGSDSTRKRSDRVFLLENGKLKLVRVRAGITDGTKTEIEGELQPGDSVITGMESAVTQAAKPFGMQQQQGGMGGGGRGFR